MAVISLRGQTINTVGEFPQAGSVAPEFKLTNAKMQDKQLADFRGKKVLLNIVPSLDTPVCAKSTKTFDQLAVGRDDLAVLIVSADLPFAQGRFCSAEKMKHVEALSMMRSRSFAKDYGVLMADGPLEGIAARAVVAIDAEGKVLYSELVQDVAQEPNYEAAMAAVSE